MIESLTALGQLIVIFLLPGSLLVLVLWPRNSSLAAVLLYGFAFSTSGVIATSSLLLWTGEFSIPAQLGASSVLAVGIFVIGLNSGRLTLSSIRDLISASSLEESIAPIAVALFVVLIGLVTPHWNFLLGSNMDAGNYELYGNHFIHTGSYFFEPEALQHPEVPPRWVESGNTWNVIPGTTRAKPSYFPAFPALLGTFKGVFDSPLASTFVPLALAAASAGLLTRAASHILGRPWLGALVVVACALTPIFFFYSKQVMAEPMALLGVSLLTDILVRYRSWTADMFALAGTAIGAGLFLALTSKLDAFVLLALLPVALFLSWLDTREADMGIARSVVQPDRTLLGFLPLVGVLSGSFLVASMVDPGYGSKLVPGSLIEYVSPPLAIIGYGIIFGGITGAVAFLSTRNRRAIPLQSDEGRPKNATSRFRSYGYALFAGLWMVFLGWNLLYRPEVPFDVDHNAHNLLRLFDVVDPMLMGFFLISSIALLVWHDIERPVLVMLILGLALLIVTSRHNRTELWWMRRYLYILIPALSIAIAGGLARIVRIGRGRLVNTVILSLVGSALVGVIAIRSVDMRPLFELEYNKSVPVELEDLSGMLSPDDVVVVPEGNPSIRALLNTKRSLDGQAFLGRIPPDEIPMAIEVANRLGARVVLAVESSDDQIAWSTERLRPIGSGTVTEPEVGYLAHVRHNPNRSTVVSYTLYELRS